MDLASSLHFVIFLLAKAHGRARTYDGILKSLQFQEKLVFDISLPPSEDKMHKTVDPFVSNSLNGRRGRIRPLTYCVLDETDNYPRGGVCSIHQTHFQNMSDPKPNIWLKRAGQNLMEDIVVVFNLTAANSSTFEEVERIKKAISISKLNKIKIKQGLEINKEMITEDYLIDLLKSIDVIILNVDIPLNEFILSYSLFKANLRETLDKKLRPLLKDVTNANIYAKLNFPPTSSNPELNFNLTEELYSKYYFYLLQYSVLWINDGENEGIILKSFNSTLAHQPNLDGGELKKIMVMNIDHALEPTRMESTFLSDCEIKAMMDHISPYFDKVSMRSGYGNRIHLIDRCILTNGSNCQGNKIERYSEACGRPWVNYSLPNIQLKLSTENKPDKFRNKLVNITQSLNALPWNFISVTSYSKFPSLTQDLDLIPSDVKIGCGFYCNNWKCEKQLTQDDDEFLQSIYNDCRFMWNQSRVIVWNIEFPNIGHTHSLTRRLFDLGKKYHQFSQAFLEKSVLLRVHLQMWRWNMLSSYDDIFYMKSGFFDLYCNRKIMRVNEHAELVINFARVHNITLEMMDTFTYLDPIDEGWKILQTISEVNMTMTKFPVFTTRNYPKNFLLGDIPTDPCVARTESVPDDGITIDIEYGGTTLFMKGMKNGSMTENELQNLLLFAFHKFSLVELVPSTSADLNTVLGVLSRKELVQKLAAQESKPVKLYLGVDAIHLNGPSSILSKLDKIVLKPTKIYFTFPNSLKMSHHFETFKNMNISIGVLLDDCVDEVNNQFQNLKKFQLFYESTFLICNVKYVANATNNNVRNVTKFLDTTLYISKYFLRMFPQEKMELMFRLNTIPNKFSTRGDNDKNDKPEAAEIVSDFLKFFSDVSQYASLNKIKLFMFPAFDNILENRFGWWKIADFNDLANSSVFFEKEAQYLNNDTWRPPSPEKREDPHPNGVLTLVLFILCGVILVLISSVMLVNFWHRRRYALLSRKEVEIFLDGMFPKGDNATPEAPAFDSRKFPMEFEISRSRIILLNMIGQGNFGLVYKATLSDLDGVGSSSVAVKIPHPGCSRESFNSILSELKVLAYVGRHPNILEFIGAYVKEIGKGITYVATELCENGALQEHLRKMHSQLTEVEADVELGDNNKNLYELSRFAHEIALGMEYIASRKIIHGDLSTRNVLLDSNLVCKIGDFGLSRKLYEFQEYVKMNNGSAGLPWRWLAIESLKKLEFTTKSDVWSYGVTIWEIFSLGSVPYPDRQYTNEFLEDLENGFRMSAPAYSTNEMQAKN